MIFFFFFEDENRLNLITLFWDSLKLDLKIVCMCVIRAYGFI